MIGFLLAITQSAAWSRDAYDIWHGPLGTSIVVQPFPRHVPGEAAQDRIRQYLRLHPDAEVFDGRELRLCVRKKAGEFILCGICGGSWVFAETKATDWAKSLSTFPLDTFTNRLDGLKKIRLEPAKASQLILKTGQKIDLPTDWCWLDERGGYTPEVRTHYLVDTATDTGCDIIQIQPKTRAQWSAKMSYSHLTTGLLKRGWEESQLGGYAICLSSKQQWLILQLHRPTTQSKRDVKRLADYIRARLAADKAR